MRDSPTLPPTTQNLLSTHLMITRAKAETFKPKLYTNIVPPYCPTNTPADVRAILAYPKRNSAMKD